MSTEAIAALAGTVVALATVVAGVRWLAHVKAQEAAGEVKESEAKARKKLYEHVDHKVAEVRGHVDVRLESERDNNDRVYARREDMTAVAQKLDGLDARLRDIQQHVHEQSKRRRSQTPPKGT